jgi:hypothetical protein
MKINIFLGLLLALTNSCGQNNKMDEKIIKKENNMNIESILKLQLLAGKSALYDETADGETYIYEEKDLLVIIPSVKSILENSGFKFISDDLFIKKIKSIFGRTIDLNLSSKYLYISPLEKCNREILYYTNENTVQINPISYYVIKKENFITDLYAIPQITDYQKTYPNIASVENTIEKEFIKNGTKVNLHLWKEFELEKQPEYNLKYQRKRNIQTLVARNMYLFNDSKAHFRWLVLNDQYFMRSLVTTFGYYDDNELNKWVADNTEFSSQNIEEVNKILYNKKCDGKIIVNYPMLELISEDEKKANEMYDFFKLGYFGWLQDDNNNLELTFSQKAEIIARLHSFIYSNMKEYRTYQYMGGFAEWFDADNKYSKEFEKHNYYNIPNFKKQWKEAKVEGDGIALPGQLD